MTRSLETRMHKPRVTDVESSIRDAYSENRIAFYAHYHDAGFQYASPIVDVRFGDACFSTRISDYPI